MVGGGCGSSSVAPLRILLDGKSRVGCHGLEARLSKVDPCLRLPLELLFDLSDSLLSHWGSLGEADVVDGVTKSSTNRRGWVGAHSLLLLRDADPVPLDTELLMSFGLVELSSSWFGIFKGFAGR